MNLYSKRLGWLVTEDKPFASGGAGQVHRATDAQRRTYCVKLLTDPKPDDLAKVGHMVDHPPASFIGGWGQLCWPLDLVRPQGPSADPVGYVMPMALQDSVELSNVTNLRWPGRVQPPLAQKLDRCAAHGLTRRMYVACNIAAAVNEVHRLGCVFVDLKPQNILIAPDGGVSLVDLDSVQIKAGARLYRGPLGSPEYMPSESYRMNFYVSPVIDPSWDRFSLAVIIYEILLGIHPFSATAKPTVIGCETIEESIRFMMYVHGRNRANLAAIPAPHEGMSQLAPTLAQLFLRAFESTDPAQRPTNLEWGMTLKAAAQGSGLSLSRNIYAPPAPVPTRRSATPAKPTQTMAPATPIPAQHSHLAERCYGPWGQTCPGERSGRIRVGLPNSVNPASGRTVYLCPDCLAPSPAVKPATAGMVKCYGPWGRSCPHENGLHMRMGHPNVVLGGGSRVFLCPDCVHLPRSF